MSETFHFTGINIIPNYTPLLFSFIFINPHPSKVKLSSCRTACPDRLFLPLRGAKRGVQCLAKLVNMTSYKIGIRTH